MNDQHPSTPARSTAWIIMNIIGTIACIYFMSQSARASDLVFKVDKPIAFTVSPNSTDYDGCEMMPGGTVTFIHLVGKTEAAIGYINPLSAPWDPMSAACPDGQSIDIKISTLMSKKNFTPQPGPDTADLKTLQSLAHSSAE